MYKGIAFSELDKSARTSHKWNFAKGGGDSLATDSMKDRPLAADSHAALRALEEQNSAKHKDWERQKHQDKIDAKRDKDRLEDIAPKPDPGSFQARMEKRATKGFYCREREASPEVKDSVLMGGSSIDPDRARLTRQKEWQDARKQAKNIAGQQKLAAHLDKEREKMNEFRKMMGLPLEGDE
mmetsp:Transcript_63030/g.92423  ORF Transcript_63030/g.92423 Transcript_63030/m.92423 type:complete len:182 (+) Transcript_63030:352-897(+)